MTQKLPQQSDWGLELSKLGSKNVKENLQPSRSDWDQELCKLDGQNLRENLQDAFDATRSAVRVAAPVLVPLLESISRPRPITNGYQDGPEGYGYYENGHKRYKY
ncbi:MULTISPECIES: hypothetical protein [Dickeya]|uniref:Uncharacterized protein n=1 Tax=Dickeya oryzae TaxID=1240404 RepID=A0ABS5BG85_9GAMM|nr:MULTISPECIES: hypothetical protein [Dickeya]MBP2847544.1 hypothetical protein [Dickeya oryzae]MBP2859406.1 hypothetical protein [Dickeya oryzae]UMB77390.1 hypothetical protein FXN80_02915 [Dickeya fangzhongdai]